MVSDTGQRDQARRGQRGFLDRRARILVALRGRCSSSLGACDGGLNKLSQSAARVNQDE
jgi:hypothetical protein